MRTLVLSVEDHVNYLDGRCPASLENTGGMPSLFVLPQA